MVEKITRYNSTYPKGGFSCSKDSFVVNGTLVFQIKFCGKSPALRVAAIRCGAFEHNYTENYSSQKQRNYEKNIDTFINRIFNFKLLE